MELGLKGKTVLVTGGSKGIGRATARAMAAEGARVMICSRSAPALEEAAGAIRRETGQAVEIASQAARAGDVVLLAPACAMTLAEVSWRSPHPNKVFPAANNADWLRAAHSRPVSIP